MNRSRPTHHKQLQLEQQRKAPLICVSVMLHQRLFASLYLFFCVCCKLLPNVFHTNDMFALLEKSAEKKTKTGRLPIAHYKQKPSGSDLWPVNRCIPSDNYRYRIIAQPYDHRIFLCRLTIPKVLYRWLILLQNLVYSITHIIHFLLVSSCSNQVSKDELVCAHLIWFWRIHSWPLKKGNAKDSWLTPPLASGLHHFDSFCVKSVCSTHLFSSRAINNGKLYNEF